MADNPNIAAWRSCYRKRLFWTHADAVLIVCRLWAQNGSQLHVYACEIGGIGHHYHVGHRVSWARRQQLDGLRTR